MKIPARRGAKTKRPRFYLTLHFQRIYVKKRIKNEEKQQQKEMILYLFVKKNQYIFLCKDNALR